MPKTGKIGLSKGEFNDYERILEGVTTVRYYPRFSKKKDLTLKVSNTIAQGCLLFGQPWVMTPPKHFDPARGVIPQCPTRCGTR
jgi:hypothetical protein